MKMKICGFGEISGCFRSILKKASMQQASLLPLLLLLLALRLEPGTKGAQKLLLILGLGIVPESA